MASGVLNFDVGNKITGVNVIDGHLLFTDNRNEPRKINIARFRDDGDHTSGTTQIYGRTFQDRDITVIKTHPSKAPTIAITSTDADDTVFEDVLPRLSYRWHFKDNEHSPFAPFSMPVFQDLGALDDSSEDRFKELFESGDIPTIKNIVSEFTVTVPCDVPDIISVDLLYTESISSTVYIAETKDVTSTDITTGTISFTVNSRNFFKALPASQLNRIFDEVPRRAKAQDIVGNRVIYGNYLEGYNNPTITATLGTTNQSKGTAVTGVRTNSAYNVGVAFIDEHGRMGGLMDIGQVETPFYNADPIKLTAQLSGVAPTWAKKFRYYVKDTSGPRYNIKSFAAFDNQGSIDTNEVWLAIASEDVNKVQEGDTIYRRAYQRINTFTGYAAGGVPAAFGQPSPSLLPIETYNKRKVLEVKSEAPESVKYGIVDDRLATRLDAATSITHYGLDLSTGWYQSARTPITGDMQLAFSGTTLLSQINDELGESKIVYVALGGVTGEKYRVTGAEEMKWGNQGTNAGTLIKLATPLNPASTTAATSTSDVTLYSTKFVDEDLRALDGKFFIRTTKEPIAGTSTAGGIGTDYNKAITWPHLLDETAMTNNGVSVDFFTVEASEDSNLDLYWEASEDYELTNDATSEFGALNTIEWVNCIQLAKNATSSPFLDVDKILDQFNSVSFGKGVRVNTPIDDPSAQRNKHKLIFSGIINPNTRTNRLNEFITADGITKDINPKYGEIQKLYAQDDLIVFCHDKVVKVLANKDALFNADENVNLIATPNVLGQAIAYKGNYGICDNPESFAVYGFNIYFTDRHRGCVLQLTPINGQINDISKRGMRDFFRDRLTTATSCIGSFDEYSGKYILSIQGYNPGAGLIDTPNFLPGESGVSNANLTIGYHANGDQSGWTSRYSFIPEWGISTLGKYYTFNGGQCWLHHDGTAAHNNFYGTQYNSEVQFIFNDNPTASSEWVSLNYEGTPGWDCVGIEADQEDGVTSSVDILDSKWFKKEGKYFAPITGEEITYALVASGVPDADGNYPLQDTGQKHPKAGVKGFFNKVRLRNSETTKQELFAVSAEYYISSQ